MSGNEKEQVSCFTLWIYGVKMIDILMATYNGEEYIAQQIDSIIGQTFTEWRLLISDDCSQDSTLSIIEKYASRDDRIKIISNGVKYGSAKSNFFSLTAHASADYVMFCDQDDVWMSDKIASTYECMRTCEDGCPSYKPIMVFTDMAIADSNLSTIADSFELHSNIDISRTAFSRVLAQSLGAGCTMMINAPLLNCMKRTLVNDSIIMHDWWATIIASAFGAICHVDEPTSLYRQHEDNSVGASRYSPITRFLNKESMVDSVRLTIKQAAEFERQFGSYLSEGNRFSVATYASIPERDLLGRLIALYKSGCWKKGMRKLGQIYAIAKL